MGIFLVFVLIFIISLSKEIFAGVIIFYSYYQYDLGFLFVFCGFFFGGWGGRMGEGEGTLYQCISTDSVCCYNDKVTNTGRDTLTQLTTLEIQDLLAHNLIQCV